MRVLTNIQMIEEMVVSFGPIVEPEVPFGTSTALSTKFDLQAMVSGQALGGPECKKKINMWDLLTLYDTKKKRMEDEAAYMSNKEQQKELM